MMLLENPFLEVPKIALVDINTTPSKTKIRQDDTQFINSEYLYTIYHSPVVSFIPSPSRPNGNQWKHFDIETIPQFCFTDFLKVRNSSKLLDSKGKEGETISARWNLKKQQLELFYKINDLYTINLKETIITPND